MEGMLAFRSGEGTTGTEGGRRPTGVPVEVDKIPSPEVEVKKTRRRHTIAYKIRVLETVSALRSDGGGAIGSYLRKEGLYYSTVRKWEKLQEEGKLTSTQTGPKGKGRQAMQAEIQQLRRKLERTEKKLKKTEMIVELQKKLSSILAMDQETSNEKSAEK